MKSWKNSAENSGFNVNPHTMGSRPIAFWCEGKIKIEIFYEAREFLEILRFAQDDSIQNDSIVSRVLFCYRFEAVKVSKAAEESQDSII